MILQQNHSEHCFTQKAYQKDKTIKLILFFLTFAFESMFFFVHLTVSFFLRIKSLFFENSSMKKVFLGGTVAFSTWRDEIIPKLEIDYFNPVVEDWNEEAYQRELYEREHCDFCLYVLSPQMEGFYSIAEVIDDANDRPNKTILCILPEDGGKSFNRFQLKSLNAVGKMVVANGARWYSSLDEVVTFLNNSVTEAEKAQEHYLKTLSLAKRAISLASDAASASVVGNLSKTESLGREIEILKSEILILENNSKIT